MEKKYCVYAHINKINGRAYVGVTSLKPYERWGKEGINYQDQVFYNAIQKYGWNGFDHIILETNISKEDISDKERYYIELYKGFTEGYNCTLGGIDMSVEEAVKYKEKSINDKYIKEYSNDYKCKKVICVNTQEIFNSLREAGETYNLSPSTIGNMCNYLRTRTTLLDKDGRYMIFRFYEEGKIYNIDEIRIKDSKNPLICLTTGDIFCGPREASRVLNICIESIINSCKNLPGGSTKYKFKYYSDYEKNPNMWEHIDKREHKVILVNTGEVYDSIKEASEKNGTSRASILHCCLNHSKSTLTLLGDNLVWQYYEDYLINPKSINDISKRKVFPIHCITTNMYFKNATVAGRFYNIDRHDICECCKGSRKYAGHDKNGNKLEWEYYIPSVNDKTEILK